MQKLGLGLTLTFTLLHCAHVFSSVRHTSLYKPVVLTFIILSDNPLQNRGMTSTYPSPEPQELCSTLYSVDQPIKFGVASERDVAGIANSSIQTHKNLRDEQHEDQLSRKKQKRIEIESKTMTSSRALRPSISSRKGTSFPRDSTLSSLQSRRYSRIRKAPEVLADSSAEDEELILKQLAQHQEDDTGAVTRVIDSASSETIAGNAEGSD